MKISIEHVLAYNSRVPRGKRFLHPRTYRAKHGDYSNGPRKQGWVVIVDGCAYFWLQMHNAHIFIRHLETRVARPADYVYILSQNTLATKMREYRAEKRLNNVHNFTQNS